MEIAETKTEIDVPETEDACKLPLNDTNEEENDKILSPVLEEYIKFLVKKITVFTEKYWYNSLRLIGYVISVLGRTWYSILFFSFVLNFFKQKSYQNEYPDSNNVLIFMGPYIGMMLAGIIFSILLFIAIVKNKSSLVQPVLTLKICLFLHLICMAVFEIYIAKIEILIPSIGLALICLSLLHYEMVKREKKDPYERMETIGQVQHV